MGLPNVGKSTLFNALTKAGIAAENYPFCTIEPNVGVVEVPDPRLDRLAALDTPVHRLDPRAKVLAERAFTFETFLAGALREGTRGTDGRRIGR